MATRRSPSMKRLLLAALVLGALSESAWAQDPGAAPPPHNVPDAPAAAVTGDPANPALPKLVIEPSSLSFSKTGDERTVTIRNSGKAPLEIFEVRLIIDGRPGLKHADGMPKAEPFTWVKPPEAKTLGIGEAMTVTVK